MNFTLTVEIGGRTAELLQNLFGGPMVKPTQDTSTAPTAQQDKAEKTPKGGGAGSSKAAPKEEAPVKEEPKAPAFADLTDEEKIEQIKAEVTKHTKRGKSSDIKALLTFVGAGRVSELQGDDIDTFMALVQRYGKGETVDALTSLD